MIYTILQNHKALELNKIEMEQSRKALEQSAKAQAEMEKTQKLQQFDSLFLLLINQLKEVEKELNLPYKNNSNKTKVDIIYNEVLKSNKPVNMKFESFRKLILDNGEVSRYFMVLYQILKNIKEKIDIKDSDSLKKQYSNIVRALIPRELLELLVVNCYTGFDKYKELLEIFSFFEHLPIKDDFPNIDNLENDMFLYSLLCNYDPLVLGQSNYVKNLNPNISYFWKMLTSKNMLISVNNSADTKINSFGDLVKIIYFNNEAVYKHNSDPYFTFKLYRRENKNTDECILKVIDCKLQNLQELFPAIESNNIIVLKNIFDEKSKIFRFYNNQEIELLNSKSFDLTDLQVNVRGFFVDIEIVTN